MAVDWTKQAAYACFPAYTDHQLKKVHTARAYGMGEIKIGLFLGEYPPRA
jgi:hypothetical protein